jgi:transposase InsO family protein
LDDAAESNLVSQRLVRELDMKPIKDAVLPAPEGFQGASAHTYGAHLLRIVLTDSLGTKKVTTGIFYAVDLSGREDVILGLPWRKDQGIVVDNSTNQWRYKMDMVEIKSIALKHFHLLHDRGTLRHAVKVSVASVTDPPDLAPLPSVIIDYEDVFENDAQKMKARVAEAEHAINLKPNTVPPFQSLRNLSASELEALRQYLATAEANGWIRRSVSEAGAPIVFAQKKDGSMRLCVDYRGLNDLTIKDRTPLPLIAETLDRLSGAQVFSALDLKDAYYRIPIKRGDEWKTAFRTRYGHFEYMVMPFGLTNAPATFQAYINKALAGYLDEFCVVYLDDILIYSKTTEEHARHLRLVMERLRQYALYANRKKCSFYTQSVRFLGFVVSNTGVSIDPDRVATIAEWPEPQSYRDIQQFIGFANYYRRFIEGFSRITKPLNKMLEGMVNGRKPGKVKLEGDAAEAFRTLRFAFTKAPILVHYTVEAPIKVETDASNFACSGILSQLQSTGSENPQWHPVAFWSRKFKPAETRYPTYDQEMLGIVGAFEHWRHYLEGATHPVQVLTDHNNLKGFMKLKKLNPRQARWATFLAAFDFEIEHRSGKTNPADAPSRRPDYASGEDTSSGLIPTLQAKLKLWDDGNQDDASSLLIRRVMATAARIETSNGVDPCTRRSSNLTALTLPRIAAVSLARGEEPYLPPTQDVVEAVRLLQRTHPKWIANLATAKRRRNAAVTYTTTDGLLYKGKALVVPEDSALRMEIIRMHHDDPLAGHFGVARCTDLITRKYFWPEIVTDVKDYIDTCGACQRTRTHRHRPYGALHSLPMPSQPFEELSMDFIVDLPPSTRDGRVYDSILVIVDRYTKMSIYIACNKTCTAEDLADLFHEEIICKYGIPKGIVSDRGSVFTSAYWSSFCYAARTKRKLSTAFHPQTDGQTERQNQALEQYLRCYCTEDQDGWASMLKAAEFAANNSLSATLKISPAYALMGYNPSLHADSARVEPHEGEVPAAVERVERIRAARATLAEQWKRAQETQQRAYNKNHQEMTFKVGDLVLLSLKNLKTRAPSKKLAIKRQGPYRVLDVIGTQAYRLALPKELSRIHNVFHVSLLEPWHSRDGCEDLPMPVTLNDDSLLPEYEVEKILEHRMRKGQKEYFVKWKGWPESYNGWEPEEHLEGAPDVLREYHASAAEPRRKRRKVNPTS